MSKLHFMKTGECKKVENTDYKLALKVWINKNKYLSESQILKQEFSIPPVKHVGDTPDNDLATYMLIQRIKFNSLRQKFFLIIPSILGLFVTAILFKIIPATAFGKFCIIFVCGYLSLLPLIKKHYLWDSFTAIWGGISFIAVLLAFMLPISTKVYDIKYEYHKFATNAVIIFDNKAECMTDVKFFNFDSTKQKIVVCKKLTTFYTPSTESDYFDIMDKK